TNKTKLTVSTKGQTFLGQIIGGPVKSITLKNVVLDGDMNDDNIEDHEFAIDLTGLSGSLKLGDIINGTDIRIAETSAKKGFEGRGGEWLSNFVTVEISAPLLR
ncbi:MAG: hypothetical protein IIA62_11455, partial [Nitrospinae bacterium]|nr:hypothetical protein [Nitrospinota bacterium]